MKKRKSQVKNLIILGSVSIFFAAFLAQAASSATSVDTSLLAPHQVKRSVTAMYRTFDGTVQSVSSSSISVKTGSQSITTARLTKNTQYYTGNTKAAFSSLKKDLTVKVRAKVINKYTLEATAVKIITTATPTPTISND